MNGQEAKVDWRIDVWSLGCIIFYLFTQTNPFSDIPYNVNKLAVPLAVINTKDFLSYKLHYEAIQKSNMD